MLFGQRLVVIESHERLAGFMGRLDVLCHGTQHPLPVRMKFIGDPQPEVRKLFKGISL